MRVGFFEVQIRRNLTALHRQCRLDQPDDSRSGFQVAEVCFDRTGQKRRFKCSAVSVHRTQGTGFNRVTQQRSSSVRFHVIDLCRRNARISTRGAQYRSLSRRVRRHQAVGSTVLIHRRSAHHSQHAVAIPYRVGEPLEDGDAATLAADEAVS